MPDKTDVAVEAAPESWKTPSAAGAMPRETGMTPLSRVASTRRSRCRRPARNGSGRQWRESSRLHRRQA